MACCETDLEQLNPASGIFEHLIGVKCDLIICVKRTGQSGSLKDHSRTMVIILLSDLLRLYFASYARIHLFLLVAFEAL